MSVLVGKQAPDFTANTVMGDGEIKEDFNLSEHISGKYAVLFFYPLDFTFVCPSELIAFDHRIEEFTSRGVEVIGCSTDSHFTHKAWRSTPINNGGIGEVKYPLVADLDHNICQSYDVEVGGGAGEDGTYNGGNGIAYRGSFLIDKSGVVRHQVINDLPLGRNIDEMLRMIDALQFTEEHGEVCPAGWNKGDKGMTGSTEGVAEYLAEEADKL
ncbi:MAG: peroxiredoxin [Gammaproteobacteria bacterium]|nr:peroxiredoxin [Gammaproteobacteria bacterium]